MMMTKGSFPSTYGRKMLEKILVLSFALGKNVSFANRAQNSFESL